MVHLTREVRFSADPDWAGEVDAARSIANSWGGWPSAVGLLPYLRLRLTVAGKPDARTGYLCNIRVLDDLLRKHAIPIAAGLLRRGRGHASVERLLLNVWRAIAPLPPPQARFVKLEACPTLTLCYALEAKDARMILLTQQFEFSASHRLHCPHLSDPENKAVFGKCNNLNGHGHNYVLEVTVAGRLDENGVVLPLPQFERVVKERVIDRLDHKHLNLDVAEFREVNPSVENIARAVWEMLKEHVAPAKLQAVRVCETAKTWAEYAGE